MTLFGPDLPRATGREAMLYLLGTGIGESVVVALPGGKHVVVDVCRQRDKNLPLALLEHLGAKTLDLLVVTHPDFDHIVGLAEILENKPPTDLWRYPIEASVRDFVTAWAKRTSRGKVDDALRAMREYLKADGDTSTAAYGNLVWPADTSQSDCVVHALAPTEFDKERASRTLNKRILSSGKKLDAWLERIEKGGPPGDAPNVISVALVLEIGRQRVLLGGDVLKGTRSNKSGWKGVLRLLEKHKRANLVTDVVAVKVPHHGSTTAFEPTAWTRHAAQTKPIALIAPFTPSSLPDEKTLKDLKPFAREVLVTSHAHLGTRAVDAGWARGKLVPSTTTKAPLVALRIHPDHGVTECFAGAGALALA